MAQDALIREMIEGIQKLSRLGVYDQITALAKGEYFLLAYLEKHGGESMPGDLCAEMDVSKARVSAALGMLKEKGYIVSNQDETDRRRLHICLTPQGEQYLLQKKQAAYRRMKEIFEQMGEEDLREYLRLTGKLIAIAAEPCRTEPCQAEQEETDDRQKKCVVQPQRAV